MLPTVSKDFAGDSTAVHTGKGSEMAQRCYSPPGCHFGVGEAAVGPGVHPGLRLPDGDPPGARHVPGQLAHGEHGRCLRAGEAQRGCGDLGPGSAEGPQPEPRARQGTQGGLESPDPLPPPAVDITDAGPEGREDQIEREGEASPSVPSGSAPSARSWSVVEHEPGDTPVKAKDLPLWVVVKRTGNAGQSRIHLNVEGTAVGCGWRPAASKVQELSVLDYMTEQEAYGKCERCFKRRSRQTGHWTPRCRRTRTLRRTQAPKRMTRWTPSQTPRWWPYLW